MRLCDALGIEKPIVFGNSFGGEVAQRYLGRHPGHPGKVVLSSTAPRWDRDGVLAMFRRLGGDDAGAAASDLWVDPNEQTRATYRRICGPLYTQSPGNMFEAVEMIRAPEVSAHRIRGERTTFDLRTDLTAARCPVLVMAGEHDPVCPIAGSEAIVSCLPPDLVQFERFEHSGHGVFRDEPERAMSVLRQFVG